MWVSRPTSLPDHRRESSSESATTAAPSESVISGKRCALQHLLHKDLLRALNTRRGDALSTVYSSKQHSDCGGKHVV